MTDYIQVATTVANRDDADRIARELIAQRLAGCVQVLGPIRSTYHWQGQIESAEEWLCLAKSRAELYEALQAAILKLHPYQTPEILATPVAAGNPAYLAWLDAELRPRPM
jgi:periplasmic divalent cation tolerance protein